LNDNPMSGKTPAIPLPTETSPPRSFFTEIETALHALHLYGAAGLAVFGWALGWLLAIEPGHWLPLWFCGALLIYNTDRLRRDPADALNLPARTAASARWRTASQITLALAAAVLLGLPVWRREWLTLGLVLGGGIFSLGYSLPILGFRWKDVPLLKTLFAPAVVTAAIFGLLLFVPTPTPPRARQLVGFLFTVVPLVPWAFSHLLFNMLLCDLRDLAGDRQCGVRSIPVLWGEKGARRLLWTLAVTQQLLLSGLIFFRDTGTLPFALLAVVTGLYQAWLLHATRHPRSERFYEWAVEGLLYLPAAACGLALFAGDGVR